MSPVPANQTTKSGFSRRGFLRSALPSPADSCSASPCPPVRGSPHKPLLPPSPTRASTPGFTSRPTIKSPS